MTKPKCLMCAKKNCTCGVYSYRAKLKVHILRAMDLYDRTYGGRVSKELLDEVKFQFDCNRRCDALQLERLGAK